MTRPAPRRDSGVATTRELLDAALAQSSRRNARVARWRIAGRWTLWASGILFRYTLMLAAVATPFALGWYVWQQQREPAAPAQSAPALASATPAAPSAPEPSSAPAASAPVVSEAMSPDSAASVTPAASAVAEPVPEAASAAATSGPRIDEGREADRPGAAPVGASAAASDVNASSPPGRLELRLDDSVTSGAASAAAQSPVKPSTGPRPTP